MKPVYLSGMGGYGDCIHQRAIVRRWVAQGRQVWIETPWPMLYRDFPGVRCLPKKTHLRTQNKNAKREAGLYAKRPGPAIIAACQHRTAGYAPAMVRDHGGVLQALAAQLGEPTATDFRMRVPDEWRERLTIELPDRPVMIYRPLMDRSEWGGCQARNPDHAAYRALFESVRDRYYVISIADLEPGKEWLVEEMPNVDRMFHAGELDMEQIAALYERASLVFTSPGFSVPLSQAIGTPVVCVFGGYEDSHSFSAGAAFSPYLGIDPIHSCQCFSHAHQCRKTIDLPSATARLAEFANQAQPAFRRNQPACV